MAKANIFESEKDATIPSTSVFAFFLILYFPFWQCCIYWLSNANTKFSEILTLVIFGISPTPFFLFCFLLQVKLLPVWRSHSLWLVAFNHFQATNSILSLHIYSVCFFFFLYFFLSFEIFLLSFSPLFFFISATSLSGFFSFTSLFPSTLFYFYHSFTFSSVSPISFFFFPFILPFSIRTWLQWKWVCLEPR